MLLKECIIQLVLAKAKIETRFLKKHLKLSTVFILLYNWNICFIIKLKRQKIIKEK